MDKDTIRQGTYVAEDAIRDDKIEFGVDLALALTGASDGKAETCPDAETLAALSEGRLSESERCLMIGHLDRCPTCRDEWLRVAAEMGPVMAEPAPRPGRLWGPGAFAGISAGAVVAACLVWFFFLHPMSAVSPGYAPIVKQGYAQLLDDGTMYASAREIADELAVETVTRGSDSGPSTAFQDGWSAGLKSIRRGFADGAFTSGRGAMGYASAVGRWTALLSVALRAQPGADFWGSQAQAALLFKEAGAPHFSEQDARRSGKVFDALAATLDKLGAGADTPMRDRLRRQLNGLGHFMQSVDMVEM